MRHRRRESVEKRRDRNIRRKTIEEEDGRSITNCF